MALTPHLGTLGNGIWSPAASSPGDDLVLLRRRSIAWRVLLHACAWIVTTGALTLIVDAAAGHLQTPERLLRIAIQVSLMLVPPVYAAAWLVDLRKLALPARVLLSVTLVALWPVVCDPLQRRFGTGAPLYALIATSGMLVMTVLAVRGSVRGLRAHRALPMAQRLRSAAEQRLVGAQLAPHMLHQMLLTLHQVALSEPTRAPAFILDLSLMMRHLVDSTRREFVAACEDWAFVEAYARYCEERGGIAAQLDLEFEGDEDAPLPAMMLVTLLTNAVRQASDEHGGFRVRLSLLMLDNGWRLRVSHAPRPSGVTLGADSEVGLALMRRRLEQLHPGRSRLTHQVRDTWHELDVETW